VTEVEKRQHKQKAVLAWSPHTWTDFNRTLW